MWFSAGAAPRNILCSPQERSAKQAALRWRETHMFTLQCSQWAALNAGSKNRDDVEWPRSRERRARTPARTHTHSSSFPLPSPLSQQSLPAHKACMWKRGRERKRGTWGERARYPLSLSFFLPFPHWKKTEGWVPNLLLAFRTNVNVTYVCLGLIVGNGSRSIFPAKILANR